MNPPLAAPTLDQMEFLSWVGRAFLFRGDLIKQLTSLGAPPGVARDFAYSDAVRHGNVLGLFEDCGRPNEAVFELFLADCWAKWVEIKATQTRRVVAPESTPPK
jgi:hypothetical protein